MLGSSKVIQSKMLGERVLFYDTDSVIYVKRPNTSNPPTGPLLGELKSELRASEHIMEFLSAGPKTMPMPLIKALNSVK